MQRSRVRDLSGSDGSTGTKAPKGNELGTFKEVKGAQDYSRGKYKEIKEGDRNHISLNPVAVMRGLTLS